VAPTYRKVPKDLEPIKVTTASTLRFLKFRRESFLDFSATVRVF
jgi:hypothetical protein